MNVVIKADEQLISKIKQHYGKEINFESNIPYTQFVIDNDNFKIIAYNSNKVMFQGKDAAYEAAKWDNDLLEAEQLNNIVTLDLNESIGSDEVGTGDYFGPVIVCSAYLNNEIASKIDMSLIKDSKILTDKMILTMAPEIMKHVPYELSVLDNVKYNEIQPKNNLNMIKAKMHNHVLLKLMAKINKTPQVILDQFCPPKLYFKYLNDVDEVYHDIIFETKAESKYLVVAIASIIARYTFLLEMDRLSLQVSTPLLKGAGPQVDLQGKELVKEYGEEILDIIAKKHFKNTKKILEN